MRRTVDDGRPRQYPEMTFVVWIHKFSNKHYKDIYHDNSMQLVLKSSLLSVENAKCSCRITFSCHTRAKSTDTWSMLFSSSPKVNWIFSIPSFMYRYGICKFTFTFSDPKMAASGTSLRMHKSRSWFRHISGLLISRYKKVMSLISSHVPSWSSTFKNRHPLTCVGSRAHSLIKQELSCAEKQKSIQILNKNIVCQSQW